MVILISNDQNHKNIILPFSFPAWIWANIKKSRQKENTDKTQKEIEESYEKLKKNLEQKLKDAKTEEERKIIKEMINDIENDKQKTEALDRKIEESIKKLEKVIADGGYYANYCNFVIDGNKINVNEKYYLIVSEQETEIKLEPKKGSQPCVEKNNIIWKVFDKFKNNEMIFQKDSIDRIAYKFPKGEYNIIVYRNLIEKTKTGQDSITANQEQTAFNLLVIDKPTISFSKVDEKDRSYGFDDGFQFLQLRDLKNGKIRDYEKIDGTDLYAPNILMAPTQTVTIKGKIEGLPADYFKNNKDAFVYIKLSDSLKNVSITNAIDNKIKLNGSNEFDITISTEGLKNYKNNKYQKDFVNLWINKEPIFNRGTYEIIDSKFRVISDKFETKKSVKFVYVDTDENVSYTYPTEQELDKWVNKEAFNQLFFEFDIDVEPAVMKWYDLKQKADSLFRVQNEENMENKFMNFLINKYRAVNSLVNYDYIYFILDEYGSKFHINGIAAYSKGTSMGTLSFHISENRPYSYVIPHELGHKFFDHTFEHERVKIKQQIGTRELEYYIEIRDLITEGITDDFMDYINSPPNVFYIYQLNKLYKYFITK